MKKVTLIPGDGIGPEIVQSVKKIFRAAGVPIEWEEKLAGESAYEACGELLPEDTLESIRRNKVALKAPLTTPVGKGFRSVNVQMRKALDLYANLRPVKTIKGVTTPYSDRNIDIVIVRENSEGLYSGVEHYIGEEAAETIKITTVKACRRIAQATIDMVVDPVYDTKPRKRVTVVHKANIQKATDGMFLSVVKQVLEDHNDEAYNLSIDDKIIDNMCMQLVDRPEEFDVIVTTNFYGDILSDLCAGLIGGLGVAPGANVGDDCAVYEAVHGTAPDIAGKGLANPTSLLLSACMMLKDDYYFDEDLSEYGNKIEAAVLKTIEEGHFVTGDLGGSASTGAFTDAIIANL
jgi:isocitrate dehydrogenase (NAD+)